MFGEVPSGDGGHQQCLQLPVSPVITLNSGFAMLDDFAQLQATVCFEHV